MLPVVGEDVSPLELSPPHAMASPKPTKPVQPAPSSRMRRALFLVPVSLSFPEGNQEVERGPSFNSNASNASSAGHTWTLPVLSTPACSGRWETRSASEEEEKVEAQEEGGLGVGSWRVMVLLVVAEEEGHGKGTV